MPKGDQYTFDNFTVIRTNKEAFEKALRFAGSPNSRPLALCGPSGTGKTHLLYAVRNYIRHTQHELNVLLTNSVEMTDFLVESLNTTVGFKTFREAYRGVDVLLVDDIHYLSGKPTIQREFILLFNDIYESGRRVMMTLSDVDGLDDRLRSRCFWGDFTEI